MSRMTKQVKAMQAALTALKSIDAAMPFPVAKFAIHHLEEALAEALAEQPKYRRGDRLICLETEEYCVIHISGTDRQWVKFPDTHIGVYKNEQLAELFELLPKEIEIEQPEKKPVACVYKATTKKGETAHFGEYSAAKAWAGWGTVEQVPLKTLTLIQKSAQPCSTCEALSRAVMLDQTAHDNFKPDWDTQAVLVEEQQRMAKRIEELEATVERQTARIVDLQTHIANLEGEE